MKTPQSKLSRRKFLLGVGAGGATATVALIAGKHGQPTVQREKAAPEGQGYHVTEHIRNYYRTAKV